MPVSKLTKREELFCHYIAETNNRITAIVESGFCLKIVENARGRDFTLQERRNIQKSAYNLLQKDKVKNRIDKLIKNRIKYLKEHGVATEIEVLKKLTDIIEVNTKDPYFVKSQVSAAKELLTYYREKDKIIDKKSSGSGESKKFIVEYVEDANNASKTK